MRCFGIALAVLGWTACVGGCNTVTVSRPFGDPLPAGEAAKLVGTWKAEDGNVLQVQQDADQTLIVGSLQWEKEQGKFTVEQLYMPVTSAGRAQLLFLSGEGEDHYVFARYELDGEQLAAYAIEFKAFEQAVKEHKLDARITEKDGRSKQIALTGASEQVADFIAANLDNCFTDEPTLTLKRIKK